jgi:glycoprotein-N-acetylgalactosamine 3-beta-galactosyltransferase
MYKQLFKSKGRRCDKIIFGTGRKPNGTNKTIQEILPEAVELDTSDAYGNLTAKSISMLKYVYETTKPDDFDWLIKADDDTYVIMDNLKWFLNDHCPNETHTYGLNFNIGGNKYHSGGGGYTISSSIVHKLGLALKKNNSFCEMKSGYEDIEVAECLKKLNVTLGESRDSKGRERFHGTSFSDHFDGIAKWMESYAMYWPKYVLLITVLI